MGKTLRGGCILGRDRRLSGLRGEHTPWRAAPVLRALLWSQAQAEGENRSEPAPKKMASTGGAGTCGGRTIRGKPPIESSSMLAGNCFTSSCKPQNRLIFRPAARFAPRGPICSHCRAGLYLLRLQILVVGDRFSSGADP